MTTPDTTEASSVTNRISYGRWITIHEARNVEAAWFDRHALGKLRKAAAVDGKHVRASTFRAGPLTGFRFVPRETGPQRTTRGEPLGRWVECPAAQAEVFYRVWEVTAE